MIHIDQQPEPESFDAMVRQPGNAFLARNPNPGKNWKNYWSRCNQELYLAYKGICAYSGEWFSPTTTSISIDHFFPKSLCPELAYEWSNYRLTTAITNNLKSDKMIVDPFEIQNGDFVLDIPSCLLKPRDNMHPSLKQKIDTTIAILHLNDEEHASRRLEILLDYMEGNISNQFLHKRYPFIAEELDRQNLHSNLRTFFRNSPY